MQIKAPVVIPAIHVFALFRSLELPVGPCPGWVANAVVWSFSRA